LGGKIMPEVFRFRQPRPLLLRQVHTVRAIG